MTPRTLLFAVAAALSCTAPPVEAAPISGKHGREEIKKTCGENGGRYWSNLDRYGCFKEDCDGKGGLCGVVCENDGTCEGSTPQQIRSPLPGMVPAPTLTLRGK